MIVRADAWQRLGETCRAAPAGSTDTVLCTRLAAYKRHVAGRYVSIDPKEIERLLPPTRCIVSEKVDKETWFLHADGSRCTLVSPTGRAICRAPVTEEAARTAPPAPSSPKSVEVVVKGVPAKATLVYDGAIMPRTRFRVNATSVSTKLEVSAPGYTRLTR